MLAKVSGKMDEMSTAASAAGSASMAIGKVAGVAGAGLTLAVIVVMSMTLPPSRREFVVATISTIVVGLGGCAATVLYFGIQSWAYSFWGLCALGSLFFVCGLPGWVIVRAAFISAERMNGKDLGEIIAMIRGWFGK